MPRRVAARGAAGRARGGRRGERSTEKRAGTSPACISPARGLCRAPGAGLGCGSPGPSLRWGERRRTGPQPITHQAGAGTAPGLPGSTPPEPNPARVRAAVPDPRVSQPAPPHRGGGRGVPLSPARGRPRGSMRRDVGRDPAQTHTGVPLPSPTPVSSAVSRGSPEPRPGGGGEAVAVLFVFVSN